MKSIIRDINGRFIDTKKTFSSLTDLKFDFYSNIIKKETGCWEWQAGKTKAGYGQYSLNKKVLYAHRLSWELSNKEIPKGMHVLHSCDNPSCINPDHLFIGTQKDNMRDKINKGRSNLPFGIRSGVSKLTEEQVTKIRTLYNTGKYSHRTLGIMFAISNRNVSSITRYETWRHLP